jgi:hypothetical protein
MARLPAEAERELKAAISAAGDSDNPEVYLGAFKTLGSRFLDAEADAREVVAKGPDSFERTLIDEVVPAVIENIFRDLGSVPNLGSDRRKDLSIKHDLSTGTLSEREPGGDWHRPARDVQDVYARLDYWSEFAPAGARLTLYGCPKRYTEFRESMRQHLERDVLKRVHRFSRVPVPDPVAKPEPALNDPRSKRVIDPPRGIVAGALVADSDFWRALRADFEILQPHRFDLAWTATSAPDPRHEAREIDWHWTGYPDLSLLARLSAVALRGAKGLGYESEFEWYEQLRRSEFVDSAICGSGETPQSDGTAIEHEIGAIDDVVKESITLCYKLEAMSSSTTASAATGLLPSHVGSETTQRVAPGAISLSAFWKDIQADFEKYANQYASLTADWHVEEQRWLLRWGSKTDCFSVPQQCKDVFNAITRKAVTELPSSGDSGVTEPWRLWLGLMRTREWGYQHTGSPRACTEQEWDAGVKDGKSLVEVRREQRYSTGDEWKKVFRRTECGRLQRLSAAELRGKSSDDLRQYYHWLQNGTIEHVFATSATFCEDLGARAFEAEAANRRSEPAGTDSAGPVAEPAAPDAGSTRRPIQAEGRQQSEGTTVRASATDVHGSMPRKRGRRPNTERRAAIREAMNKHGEGWRDHIDEVFAELDSSGVSLGDFQSIKIEVGDDQSTSVHTWADLDLSEGKQRRQVMDALRKYLD